MKQEKIGHHRKTKRSLVLIAASVRTDRGELKVRLRNLSCHGALLEAEKPPETGVALVFERGETIAPARVAWVSGCRFGIQFNEPIEEHEVLIHIGRPQPKPDADPNLYKRTGLRPTRLKPLERYVGESWFTSLGNSLGE